MDAQTLLTHINVVIVANGSPAKPAQACSRDYGFDFDEEEIAREMIASLPVDLSSPAVLEVDIDEFEQGFQWFLS